MDLETNVVVVGSGPSGLTAALALAQSGLATASIGPQAAGDFRTSALLVSSLRALDQLGVWPACAGQAAPLRKLRIVDATGRLLRAPEVCFDAQEIGLEAFGWNIENRDLVAALEARAAQIPALQRIGQNADMVECRGDRVLVRLADGRSLSAQLAVGADGRQSLCRAAAGIGVRQSRYPQVALTFNVAHSRPHRDISTEFHTEAGPFTTVPLPGLRSSIVCVVTPQEAQALQALDGDALNQELERRSHSILGKIEAEAGRGVFPLIAEAADRYARNRVILIGEAAHRIPPIGAQGLNLGLRDAATVADVATEYHMDPGAPTALARYEALRRADVTSRTMAVDIMNRSLLSDFLPMQGVRGLGLYLLNAVGPLRRAVMREGVTPRLAQPSLMRDHLTL